MSARRDQMQNLYINARREETEPGKFKNFHAYCTAKTCTFGTHNNKSFTISG